MDAEYRNVVNIGAFSKVLNSFFVYTGDESDYWVQRHCRDLGIWDKELTDWMLKNIKPGWKCLDIGANIGYFTEVMARLVGKEGSVIAFEPLQHLNENYKISTLLNNYDHCGHITMQPYALSNKSGNSQIYLYLNNVGASRLDNTDSVHGEYIEQTINTIRLDSIYTETPDFIKIDIEGHEIEAFEGMHEKTKMCPLIVAEIGLFDFSKFKLIFNDYSITNLDGTELEEDTIPDYTTNVVLRKR